MAGKPGSKEAYETEQKHLNVESSESAHVKWMRAHYPRPGDDDFIEGSE
jgi:hypothetical protein